MNTQPEKNCPNKEPHECNNNGCNCHNNGKCCHAVEVFVNPTQPEKKCECCGWDDAGFQHEPYCPMYVSLTHDQVQWKDRFDEIANDWKEPGFSFERQDALQAHMVKMVHEYKALMEETLQRLHDEIREKKVAHHVKWKELQAIFTRYGVKI